MRLEKGCNIYIAVARRIIHGYIHMWSANPLNVFFLCILSLAGNIGYASQTYYIDPSQLIDGDGTQISPWNTFTHINPGGSHTFSGTPTIHKDNDNSAILIKSDTEIHESLIVDFGDNFVVGKYGTGEYPILNGADPVTGTWIQEGNLWYLDSQTDSHALYVKASPGPGSLNDIQLVARVNKADVGPNQQWYESSSQRLYADFDGQDPNALAVEISSRTRVIWMRGCRNYTVQNIHAMKGDNSNLVASNVSDQARWIDNRSTFAGNWGSGGRSTMSIYGPTGGVRSTGVVIRGNVIRYAINTGIEVGNLDGALIEDNDIQHTGMGIELWETVTNSIFRNNLIRDIESRSPDAGFGGHGNGFWLAPNITSAYGGHNDTNVFAYNIIQRTVGSSVDLKSGMNNVFYNNVFAMFDGQGSTPAYKCMVFIDSKDGVSASTGNTLKNNVFYQRTQHRFLTSAAGTHPVLDNNQYYSEFTGANFAYFSYDGVSHAANSAQASFASYRAGTGQDGDGAYGDPIFVDIDNDDFRTYPASPLIDSGADVGLSSDFNHNTLDATPDKGAIEYQSSDTDMDGLSDSFEAILGTDPLLTDTDNDGLSDFDEVNYDGNAATYNPANDLNPLSADTDGDGVDDATELANGTDPLDPSDFILQGDVNLDGQVNLGDYLKLIQFVLGMGSSPSTAAIIAGDLNGNTQLDTGDIVAYPRTFLGL